MARTLTRKQLELGFGGAAAKARALNRKKETRKMARKKTTTRARKATDPTTIVVRDSTSVALAQRPRAAAPARRSAPVYIASAVRGAVSRFRGGGSKGPRHVGATVRKGVAVAGVVIGYLDRPGSPLEATMQKIPALGGSRKITLAIGLHMLAKKRPGGYIDHGATAMTAIAAYDVGRNGFGNLGVAGPGDSVARF